MIAKALLGAIKFKHGQFTLKYLAWETCLFLRTNAFMNVDEKLAAQYVSAKKSYNLDGSTRTSVKFTSRHWKK